MKGYKGLVPIALAVCIVLSFYMLINTRAEVKKEYDGYLTAAREKAEQGIMVDALVEYANAMGVEDSVELNLEVGEFYVKMGEMDSAIGWGQQMIEKFPKSAQAYEFLLTRYRENNDFHRCYALYEVIAKRELVTPKVTEIMEDIKYVFYYGEGFDDVQTFSEGYCAVLFEEKWGLVTETGEKAAPCKFESVGAFIDGLSPVIAEGEEVFFIDNEGNKKKIILSDGKIIELKPMVGGVYAAYNGSSWAFYNEADKKISGDYSDTSLFANTVAAVQLDGKWQVVDSNFQKVLPDTYVDVVQDDRGIIYRNGILFVGQDEGYYMVDITGKKITEQVFDDAKLFSDATYAAVKTDDGWTFVDATGAYVFKDTYFEDARSFSNGFAAVCKDGMWGYIDLTGNVAIDYQFGDAKDFNASGCAFVRSDNGWILIRLYSMNYET